MKKIIPSPLHLYLIRHGETEWAIYSRHTGRTDIPLTANGVNEARELGRHLRDIRFAHVLTSPLKRALQTCELVGLDNVPEIEPDLAEWDYGDYEGKRSVDIRKNRQDWNVFRDGCPHGEMPAQISERADRLIARLRTLDGKVALFSHGQFGGVLAVRWIGLPLAEARHFPLGTASLSIFAFNPQHPEVPVIALWNAASHDIFNKSMERTLALQHAPRHSTNLRNGRPSKPITRRSVSCILGKSSRTIQSAVGGSSAPHPEGSSDNRQRCVS